MAADNTAPAAGAGKGKKKKVAALEVRSAIEGFRRAGRAWSKEPTTVAASLFTEDQIASLRAEPNLIVTETEIDAADAVEAEVAA